MPRGARFQHSDLGCPYVIGNTLLTIFGMAVVLLMSSFG
jgi:hypothetical protein